MPPDLDELATQKYSVLVLKPDQVLADQRWPRAVSDVHAGEVARERVQIPIV